MRSVLGGRSSLWPFLALAAAVGIAALFFPRTPQPLSYHQFADRRSWLGIPNFGDVVSNIPFLVAGFWGLAFLCRTSSRERFIDARERWPYVFLFLGLVLTAGGSAYDHLAPDNARLVWDRLPMTFVFMPLVAAILAERVNVKLGLGLLPLLVAVGMRSVIEWHWSEQQDAGDPRFYAAVELYALLALLVALLLPPRYTRGPAGRGRSLCTRKNMRSSRSPDFFLGRLLERAHAQTFGRRRRGILDAREKAACFRSRHAPGRRSLRMDRRSALRLMQLVSGSPAFRFLLFIDDAARHDGSHRPAFKVSPVEGRVA